MPCELDVSTIDTGEEAMLFSVVKTVPSLYVRDQGGSPVRATATVAEVIPSLQMVAVSGLVILAVGNPSSPMVR
jgi:hypothetical protein